jgi:S-adenosylmethionine hydrolase
VKFGALATDLVDAFGPIEPGEPLEIAFGLAPGGTAYTVELRWQRTFGAVGVGEPLMYEDSYGRLCFAINQGDAVRSFGLVDDQAATIARPRSS